MNTLPWRSHPGSSNGTRFKALVIFLALMTLAPGCGQHSYPSFDRINHLHSDANQKLAEASGDDFGKFTSQQEGLAATLAKNLEARKEMEKTVSLARNALDDAQRAFLTTDISWINLRIKVFKDLGLPQELIKSDNLDLGNYELSERIHVRQLLVGAVAKDLGLLGKIQQALLDQARADAKAAKDDLEADQKNAKEKSNPIGPAPEMPATGAAATQPATTPPTAAEKAEQRRLRDQARCKRIAWAMSVVDAFQAAGRELEKNAQLRSRANAFQAKLLDEIRSSRDPVGAHAIVALLGTGLGEDDFDVLKGYIAFLDAELTRIKPPESEGLTPELTSTDLNSLNGELAAKVSALGAGKTDPQAKALAARAAVETWKSNRASNKKAAPDVDSAAWFGLNLALLEAQQTTSMARSLAWTRLTERKDATGAAKRAFFQLAGIAPPAETKRSDPLNGPIKKYRSMESALALLFPELTRSNRSADRKEGDQDKGADAAVDSPFEGLMAVNVGNQSRAVGRRVINEPLRPLTNLAMTNEKLRPIEENIKESLNSIQDLTVSAANSVRDTRMTLMDRYRELQAVVASTPKAATLVTSAAKARAEAQPAADKQTEDSCKLEAPKDLDAKALNGFELLKLVLSADPQAVVLLGKLVNIGQIPSAQLDIVGKFANDITKEVLEAKVRIRQFLAELSQIHVDTAAENSRHMVAMLAVAEMEAKRWQLLGHLNEMYFVTTDPTLYPPALDPHAEKDRSRKPGDESPPPPMPLFQTYSEIHRKKSGWYDRYADLIVEFQKKNDLPSEPDDFRKAPTGAADHPPVYAADPAFVSIRKLADTARVWHKGSQFDNDPLGWHLSMANTRLQLAVRLLDGQLLMLSLNERLADENAIRLQGELAEHDLHLDSLDGRAREAGFRLGLGDLKAFHTSGITEADIRAIESGLLTWIGYNVKKN